MAITIHTQPQLYSPSDNPLTYVFSSDETAQANFQYIVDVIVNGNVVSKNIVFPEVGARAHIDVSEIVSQYIEPATIQDSFNASTNNYNGLVIQVFEKYGTPATIQDNGLSTTIYPFKAALKDVDFEAFDYTQYLIASGTKFISQFPDNEKAYCSTTQDFYLQLITENNSVLVNIDIYDNQGNIINSESGSFPCSRIEQFNIGIQSVVDEFASISISDFDNCEYYDCRFIFFVNTITKRIYKDPSCYYEFNPINIYFLSKIGSIETFVYGLLNRRNSKVESKSFERQYGGWNGTDYEYNSLAGRNISFFKSAGDTLTINSDFIPEDVQNWLVENLYESPYVIILDGDNLRRCNIEATSYEKKRQINDGLIQEEVNLSLSNHRKSIII